MSKKRVFLWQNNGVVPGAIETDLGGGAVHDYGWINAQRIEVSGGMFCKIAAPTEPMTPQQAHTMISELQSRAALAGLVLRAPPPEPTTCCGRGCNGCVWEGFLAAAQFWEEDALTALVLQKT